MEIVYGERFVKNFKKLPVKIQDKFEEGVGRFIINPRDPVLKMHPLKGNLLGYRAFSVTGDYRVMYRLLGPDLVKLVNIWKHSSIYGK